MVPHEAIIPAELTIELNNGKDTSGDFLFQSSQINTFALSHSHTFMHPEGFPASQERSRLTSLINKPTMVVLSCSYIYNNQFEYDRILTSKSMVGMIEL